jgi:hypothetical protein
LELRTPNFVGFAFCEAIIAPKTELVNSFLEKSLNFFRIMEFFYKNPFTKRKNSDIIIPQEENAEDIAIFLDKMEQFKLYK